jgi:hypothetical protein
MNGYDTYLIGYGNRRAIFWERAGAWVAVFLLAGSGLARAQSVGRIGGEEEGPSSIHGTVLNQITREPISRALVFSPGEQYATLTDDRGHFEFKLSAQRPAPALDEGMTEEAKQRAMQHYWAQNSRPGTLMARKLGFREMYGSGGPLSSTADIKIYLVPESLVVGQVSIPWSEGEVRIPVQLYRHEINEGQERWVQSGTFRCWSDGAFRFAGLRAGTYKVATGEEIDRDPLTFNTEEQVYGFPPVFYPNANDFVTASPIQIGAGVTFQANLTVARREYYRVKIPVASATPTNGMQIRVNPLGHSGPGYSLGYNPMEQAIEGMLPNGNYTLETETFGGEMGATGLMNFSVRGAAFEGGALNLVPNASANIKVKEELKNTESDRGGGPQGVVGPSNRGQPRRSDVQVVLNPIEEFPFRGGGGSRLVSGGEKGTLVIPNIMPGRYHLHVYGSPGYVASVVSGGADLLHGELVVGLGAAVPTIEITLRDDGAEVAGEIEGAAKKDDEQEQGGSAGPQAYVYFLPVSGSGGQFRETPAWADNRFQLEQVPPGSYRVLAFDQRQGNLEYADAETMRAYEPKGEVIQVSAGQKETLRLKVISGGDSQ